MKRNILLALALATAVSAYADNIKPALTHDVYDSWQSISGIKITPDGAFSAWTVAVQQGDDTLHIRNAAGKELMIPRATGLVMSNDSKWAYCTIKPFYAQTRQAKIEKKAKDKMPKDTLAVIKLADLSLKKYEKSEGFKAGDYASPYVAYKYDKGVIALNPATGAVDTLKSADSYFLNRQGTKMVLIYKKDKKDSLSADKICLYDFASASSRTLDEGQRFYSSPAFTNDGRLLSFIASADSLKTGSKHSSIYVADLASAEAPRKVVDAAFRLAGKDSTLIVNENAAPYFSAKGSRLFFGMGKYEAPKDTSIVEFEQAQLDIWNWDALLTPPMYKANKAQYDRRTYPCVVSLANPDAQPVILSHNNSERVQLIDGADNDFAFITSDADYRLSSYWDSNEYSDAYIVNLNDGSRKELWHKKQYSPSISPKGRYACWFDYEDAQWYLHDLTTGATRCLTDKSGVTFHDETDDHPSLPTPYGSPVWTADESSVIIPDRYDYWRFTTAAEGAYNVTNSYGRRNKTQLRRITVTDYGFNATDRKIGLQHYPGLGEAQWYTSFNETSKENGYAVSKDLKRSTDPYCFLSQFTYGTPVKAAKAAAVLFQRGNFTTPNTLYRYEQRSGKGLAADFGYDARLAKGLNESGVKLTDINRQMKNYRWGDVKLVHWNAYDGTPLDGLLFVPDGVEEGEKLPMMVYFYEKNSETMYSYRSPAPSRSTVNIPYFVSNGYCVFVPDVVYEPGHPGPSAYNCIVSGSEAMCEQFPFIDRSKMAIQGQSWGGYQVAYLVTCTDIYAAAGAGAPVGNMTSAYGGIRWESGLVRAMQYEHGQSRIGKSMWEEGGLELYIENSPVFHVNKVTTPVLIMHNDADGAVPWYQGIEFFSNLRRFGKQAWMLEYNNEAHNLGERRNAKDLSVRLSEFFDHFLKGAPMPKWMISEN